MILLRRERVGPHLPGAWRDRPVLAADAASMKAYHAWTRAQLGGVGLGERYELRPVL